MGLFGTKKDNGKVTQRFADGGYVKQPATHTLIRQAMC